MSGLKVGDRICHKPFGEGTVMSVLDNGAAYSVAYDIDRSGGPETRAYWPPTDPEPTAPVVGDRRIELTAAGSIKPRPVLWLWRNRLALGTIGLLAGREGQGKSTLGYWLAARITRGDLPGEFEGLAKSVLVCATEDSWEHTIVPRLMAAGADLERVYRVEVVSALGVHVGLSLPRDIQGLAQEAAQVDAALLLLDPLMSRLGALDTHRDAEVRQALEPLAALADRARLAVLGLIHHNKSGSSDPLQLVMGSKAFTAVARSVHTVVPDPDDETETRRLFGTPKNNLGRADLPTLSFTIQSHGIPTDEGTAWTSQIVWGEDRHESIGETMRRATDDDRSATTEAAGWLSDYLVTKGGQAASADIKRAGHAAGHSDSTLKRARSRMGLRVTSAGMPRVTYWELASVESLVAAPVGSTVGPTSRGDGLTDLTGPTEHSRVSGVSQVKREGPGPTDSPVGAR